ncbi:DMT family transporter [Stenotrophomonas sp. VV52]|uniref:DMT family transporter n=1 Tax=Stenotrophomonas sp. VV52 TaxID=2066958 RepID=UPI000C9EC457|nr:DMT family transporter [Stenotrophomonas sp. VV52]
MLKLAPFAFLVTWGSGAVFVKLGLEEVSVWPFLAVRAVGAFLVLTAVCIFAFRGQIAARLFGYPAAVLGKILAAGVLLQVAYQGAFFLAISEGMSPGLLAIILGLQPILASLIGREDAGVKGYLLLACGFLGLAVSVAGSREIGGLGFSGAAFGVLSVASISAGSVLQQRVTVHPLASSFHQSLVAAVVFLVVMLFTDALWAPGAKFVLAASWMIVVVSTGATLLLLYMLKHDSAGKVGSLFYLVPAVALAFDYLMFGQSVSLMTVAGALLVVTSIILYRRHQTGASSVKRTSRG